MNYVCDANRQFLKAKLPNTLMHLLLDEAKPTIGNSRFHPGESAFVFICEDSIIALQLSAGLPILVKVIKSIAPFVSEVRVELAASAIVRRSFYG
jgi:hypothetical protein